MTTPESEAVPAPFARAVAAVRAARPRSEMEVVEIAAPTGLAPYAIALAADVRPTEHGIDSVLGTGRFVLLYDPEEPDAWDGPSLVIAYSTCIAHGIDMTTSMSHQKDAVRSGYWPLYRYRPSCDDHQHPFQLDSAAPTLPLHEFAMQEARFAMLARTDPERSAELMSLAQAAIDERWRYYEQLSGLERTIPHTDARDVTTPVSVTPKESP